jgi:osmotically-inducible protein OsmY
MKTDSEIQKNVIDELKWEPALNASEIGVAVKDGIVTLTGTVDSYWKKMSAEKAAKRVAGVRAVAQEVEVELVPTGKKNDAEIAEAVLNALKWNSSVNDEKIKVKVEDGWVTLEGEVEWAYQRKSAERTIEDLEGIKGITNSIRIVATTTASEIKEKIRSALERNAAVDAERIEVEIDGDQVTLRGKVRSLAEQHEAEAAASLAPGVNKVINELKVDSEIFAY